MTTVAALYVEADGRTQRKAWTCGTWRATRGSIPPASGGGAVRAVVDRVDPRGTRNGQDGGRSRLRSLLFGPSAACWNIPTRWRGAGSALDATARRRVGLRGLAGRVDATWSRATTGMISKADVALCGCCDLPSLRWGSCNRRLFGHVEWKQETVRVALPRPAAVDGRGASMAAVASTPPASGRTCGWRSCARPTGGASGAASGHARCITACRCTPAARRSRRLTACRCCALCAIMASIEPPAGTRGGHC